MTRRSQRNLGAMEAQKDDNFQNHFIEVHNLEKIVDDDSDIVYGLKGSGKTALCRAITELNKDKFLATRFINLDSISFSQINAALEQLNKTTSKEIIKLSSKTWHNVLLIYGIETYADLLDDNSHLKKRIENFITKKKYYNTKSNNRLIIFISNLLNKIREVGLDDDDSPLGLTVNQIEEIDKTFDDELHYILEECNKLLQLEEKKIILCLDGFDSIIDHTVESRRAIFSGLVDAVYKCSKDPVINKNFCFKAFLPRELTDSVRNIHFDADKHIFNTHYLNWTNTEFKELICKRLARYSKRSRNFKDIWSEHMPEKVVNTVHNIEENTLEYILRHTLYRPRHVLIHLQCIFDEWDSRNSSQKVDPSFIPPLVSKTNIHLAELISAELEYTISGITQFLHSWNTFSCTISFAQFLNRMKKMFKVDTIDEQRILFDKLYNIGIIGFHRNTELRRSNKIECSFAYANSALGNRMVFNSLEENDIIALSPIFQEYCGCDNSEFGCIYHKTTL